METGLDSGMFLWGKSMSQVPNNLYGCFFFFFIEKQEIVYYFHKKKYQIHYFPLSLLQLDGMYNGKEQFGKYSKKKVFLYK